MKRSALLALVAALALAAGVNVSAVADTGAQASAKKVAKKKAAKCKTAKKKAGKSLADSAKKKKAAKCKKAKPKSKAKPKGPAAAFGDGAYEDASRQVTAKVSGGKVSLTFVGNLDSCMPDAKLEGTATLTNVGTARRGSYSSPVTDGLSYDWTLTVQSDLSYEILVTYRRSGENLAPCEMKITHRGTFTKK